MAEDNARKVVIINGSEDILELFESVLDPGHYDIITVDTDRHGFSTVANTQPDLVILCLQIEDLAGFLLLSALKLDPTTTGIPILTYLAEYEGEVPTDDQSGDQDEDDELFDLQPRPLPMN